MVAHEIRMEDDIAVDLDDVGACGARDRLVADAADAESGVLLPYVDDRDGRLHAVTCDQLCGALVRTVVSISAGATVCRKLLFRQSSNASGQL